MPRHIALVVGALLAGSLIGPASPSPALGDEVGVQADSLTVRPVYGPAGTEVRIKGYVTPESPPCNFYPIPINFVDSSGHATTLYSFRGGPVDITRNIPADASLGQGTIRAIRAFYDPALHRCRGGGPSTPFTVTSGPGIFGFSPRSGPVGAQVTITGIRFIGTVAVKFNGTPSIFTVDSSSQITATVPQGATTGPIEVDVRPVAGLFLVQAISGPDFVVT